ncbi:MAG: tRNA 2-thiouridine(34) synthase MnmA, partial [Bacteroides sp.]|nr:tRNA 2-thiouridine(34) synthase MnmA [Bacteroides sp.]
IGVCFCPLDYRSFLKREVPMKQLPGRGHFLDEKGNVLGWHEGYPFYTIGQRRGLGIHLNRAVFVKEVRMETNEVVLAPLASLYKKEMYLKDWNLISAHRVLGAETVIVKIRYRKQANRCMVAQEGNGYLRVSLLEPLESIAPGQAAAFYDADGLLLGGGIIL